MKGEYDIDDIKGNVPLHYCFVNAGKVNRYSVEYSLVKRFYRVITNGICSCKIKIHPMLVRKCLNLSFSKQKDRLMWWTGYLLKMQKKSQNQEENAKVTRFMIL